jgi:hypothetical protein
LIPRQIGSVRLGEFLGEGGMALVHRGQDLHRPELQLAVKLLRPETHGDADLVRRFLQEGEVLTRLQHPHLVEVHGFGKSGSWPYLIMELLSQGSVKACMGEAPGTLVRRLLGPIGALNLAHTAGVIHRDLKPSNLLFAEDGRLKVTDFGVCLWEGGEGTRMTKSQMVVGTLGFMAPEQHGDPRRVDGRCDIYALGAILYEYTTGRAYAQVQLPPATVRPGYPVRLARILMQALAPNPEKRISSMAALEEELLLWLDSAEAAGWGELPLPGFIQSMEEETLARGSKAAEATTPAARLGPYLDGLASGPVGPRRAAAEGLVRSAKTEDESFLLDLLVGGPETSRFALCQALGKVGGSASLPPLLDLLGDPFARGEAAEAAALVAQRTGEQEPALSRMRLGGLGEPWIWEPRAMLGDEQWSEALITDWDRLPQSQRVKALEAAGKAPEGLRQRLRAGLRDRAGSLALQRLLDSL